MFRKICLIVLVLALSYVWGTAIGSSAAGPHRGGAEVAPWPATEHIEWDQHNVEGYTLCSPDTMSDGPDAGKYRCVPLPEGAILLTPRTVKGASDEDRKAWQ